MQGRRWALRAPRPAPGWWTTLDPHLAKYYGWYKPTTSACHEGTTIEMLASGPRKTEKTPQRKACFPLRGFSCLSPDALHPGLAAKPPGQKHHGAKTFLFVSFQAAAATNLAFSIHASSAKWVQGGRPLVRVYEGRTGPRPVHPPAYRACCCRI